MHMHWRSMTSLQCPADAKSLSHSDMQTNNRDLSAYQLITVSPYTAAEFIPKVFLQLTRCASVIGQNNIENIDVSTTCTSLYKGRRPLSMLVS